MTCDLGTMESGATVTITLTSPTTAASCTASPLSNRASVTTSNDGVASSHAENEGAEITINCAQVVLAKTPDNAIVESWRPDRLSRRRQQ